MLKEWIITFRACCRAPNDSLIRTGEERLRELKRFHKSKVEAAERKLEKAAQPHK